MRGRAHRPYENSGKAYNTWGCACRIIIFPLELFPKLTYMTIQFQLKHILD